MQWRKHKWLLLALSELHREHLVSVKIELAASGVRHNTQSQLRRVVSPHLVVSPLV